MKKNTFVWLFVFVLIAVFVMSFATPMISVKAGNLDLEKICSDQGWTLVWVENNAYGAKCMDAVGVYHSMDLDSACKDTHGPFFKAYYLNFNRIGSWQCLPIVANPPQK